MPTLNRELFENNKRRSGSFFLGTHNKKFRIKSINEQDIVLIKDQLLDKIIEFFYQHKKSLSSRLYCIYSITINKDVCGMFQQNVITKYDLKGSKLNREVIST